MALPTAEIQANVVSAAAQTFVDQYYEALARRQNRNLDHFYASTSPRLAGAGIKPDISINGRVCESVAEFESLLETQGSPASYDVRSFDAHPVNPAFGAGRHEGGDTASVDKGDLVSFAVQVSGILKLGKGHVSREPEATDGAVAPVAPTGGNIFGPGEKVEDAGPIEKQFNEAFLLVPHWEAWAKNPPKNMRKWVIVSQNYRTM
ncbi:hypothetical protein F4821DRAFT_250892 [Hypoxylon rubiginosum]|uniref:Uncharacterized protein n=1 Tax=Hypoxylon rubiginosum TaxID=110542 RepID=A0ACC0CJV5_9PEZI|nr:hypothetical protein F4821DRAFT_250892 [Hypoxylon rubiginosum]